MLVVERLANHGHPFNAVVITTPEGRRVVVRLVRASNTRATLGIEADRDVTINRAELEAKK